MFEPSPHTTHHYYYGCQKASSIPVYLHNKEQKEPYVIIAPEEDFDSIEQGFLFFHPDSRIWRLPALDPWFPSKAMMGDRVKWLYQASVATPFDVFLCSKKSLLQKTIPPSYFQKYTIQLTTNTPIPSKKELLEIGYIESETIEERGYFCQKGHILDIFSYIHPHPIRIEAIGDQIENIYFFNLKTNRNIKKTSSGTLPPTYEAFIPSQQKMPAVLQLKKIKLFPKLWIKKISQSVFFPEQALLTPFIYNQSFQALDFFKKQLPHTSPLIWSMESDKSHHFPQTEASSLDHSSVLSILMNQFYFKNIHQQHKMIYLHPVIAEKKNIWPVTTLPKSWPSNEKLSSHFVCIATPSENQIQQIQLKLEKSHFKPHLINHSQRNWNEWKEEQARNKDVIHLIPSLIPDHFQMDQCLFLKGDDLLEKICSPKVSETFYPKTKSNALRFSEIKKGDFIVDKTYGIGLYKGLKILTLHNQKAEYIELEYKDKDRLYVPISQIHRLYPFKTKTGVNILDQLGSPYWNRKMAKASRSIQNLILDLLKMYTARSQINRTPFQPPSQNFIKFEKEFPFEETPDQARSIQEVLKNMTSSHPMERLIIGDSGYGKTEVAMRATFKAVEDGYQVACLAPTTILSLQHFKNFKDRFSKWPVQIDLLNRLVTPSKRKDLLQNISTQKTDIVIGSHRLLSSDIQFKNLGLLIIDEEHRFGVKQKEKFKKMKTQCRLHVFIRHPYSSYFKCQLKWS